MNPSPEQQSALDAALSGNSFFLTGSAGTGKSFTLQRVIELIRQKFNGRPGSVAVVAPTGAAALQVGGTTIHSYFGLSTVDKQTAPTHKSWNRKAWFQLQVLVIDEISMVADWMLDLLDRMGRESRRQMALPFGGVQLILCGDFLQLPPIGGQYCFKSKAWQTSMLKCIELQFAYRQGSDQEFASLLLQVRMGQASQALLDSLTHRHNIATTASDIEPTRLYCKRNSVEEENTERLHQLPGQTHTFSALDCGPPLSFDSKKLATWSNAPTVLSLKIHAQVVLLKNLDIPGGLVNGSRGVVVGFSSKNEPVIRFLNGTTLTMERAKWTHSHNDDPHYAIATRLQYPLDLAWAITIHKSQGMSMDCVYADLTDCFQDGMTYVALSRCRTLAGLTVVGLSRGTVRASREAIAFYEGLRGQGGEGKRRRTEGEEEQEEE